MELLTLDGPHRLLFPPENSTHIHMLLTLPEIQ